MKRFPLWSVIIVAAAIAAVALFFERMGPPTEAPPQARKEAPGRELPEKRPTRGMAKPPAPMNGYPHQPVAVIIDDIGFDLRMVEELAKIPAPIAFAVLPNTPYAAEAAGILHAAGKEILLHLPMEPRSYPAESPGTGALMVDMDERQIRRQVQKSLTSVPHVSGVNNHMGSRFMADEARLTTVMEELAKRGLYFIDSRTTPDSRGREAANRAGVPFAARGLFIDHTPGYAAALENLVGASRRRGSVGKPLLMIGHPHPETVRALRDALPHWQAEGVRLVAVPTFLKTPGGESRNEISVNGKASDREERIK